MTVQSLASHITQSLPDDTNPAALLATCGYIASVILAGVKDRAARAEASTQFMETLEAALAVVNTEH